VLKPQPSYYHVYHLIFWMIQKYLLMDYKLSLVNHQIWFIKLCESFVTYSIGIALKQWQSLLLLELPSNMNTIPYQI